jgi:hypothetical protein
MKKLLNFAIAITIIFYFTGCDNSTDAEFYEAASLDSYEAKASANSHHEGKMVTVGLNLVFTGNYVVPTHASECGDGTFPVKNVGTGTGTHFKKVNSYFEFCVRPTATGGTYPEGYMVAYFEDEDGDRLYVNLSGEVIGGRLPGMPSYALSYFRDPFTIDPFMSTGKFEGATGEGYTNDYNFINQDGIQQTSHHWQGKITMKKGKN